MICQSCGRRTFVSSSPEAIGGHIISPAEKHFWERITFRQFAILLIRVQAVWFMADAVMDLTYLPSYFHRLQSFTVGETGYAEARQAVFTAILRLIINVACAMACLQFAEKILSWLIKDLVPRSEPVAKWVTS